MDPIETPNAFTWLRIRFELSTIVLTNVANFETAVGVAVLAVDVVNEDVFNEADISISLQKTFRAFRSI
jgi:hypothetical protein